MHMHKRELLKRVWPYVVIPMVLICVFGEMVADCTNADAQVKPIATVPVSLTTQVTGTLPPFNGGTGQNFSSATGVVKFTSGSAAATSISLTSDVSGTLPHGNGGTDVTSPGSNGNLLTSNGTSWTSAAPASVSLTSGVTGTLPHGNGGTDVTSPGSNGNLLTSNGTSWTSAAPASVSLTSGVTGTLPHGNGGTDVTSPGANGNVLTSNGTNWVSQAPTGGSSTAPFFDPATTAALVNGTTSAGNFSEGYLFTATTNLTLKGLKVWYNHTGGPFNVKIRLCTVAGPVTVATATASVTSGVVTEIDFSSTQSLGANTRYALSAYETSGTIQWEWGAVPGTTWPSNTVVIPWSSAGLLYYGTAFASGDACAITADSQAEAVTPVFQ